MTKHKQQNVEQQQHIDHDKHPKQAFQVERLAFFSDAVFAIAITLLIIEFKIPHIANDSTFDSVWKELIDLRYNLLALLLSFTLIATYWFRHHFLFKHIHNYNKQIVIANMFVLLPIIFFPFTTAFLAESIENQNVAILALRFFVMNHIIAGLTTYIFYWLALVKYKELSFEIKSQEKIKFTSDTLFTTIIFSIILLETFLTNHFDVILWTTLICSILKKLFDKFAKMLWKK